MKAVILERNRMVSRRLVRYLATAGCAPVATDDPGETAAELHDASLLCADGFDGAFVATAMRNHPRLRAVLWTAEPLRRSLRYFSDNDRISSILGRADFDSAPRRWELMMVLRRLRSPEDGMPPFSAYLDWGHRGFETRVASTAERDAAVQRIHQDLDHLGAPKRVGEMFSELAHELLMNAMFDAPADDEGRPRYAMNRKAALTLEGPEQPTLRFGTDGARVVVQVCDPFGRLERRHVAGGLVRGLEDGEMDRSNGGAGLGLAVCHNASVAMFFDVVRGVRTEVTGVFDLDLNLREFRTLAKSIHFFQL